MKRTVIVVIGLTVLAAAGGLSFIYSGAYDVAATTHHFATTVWALDTLSDRSVAVRAKTVAAPVLDDSMIGEGLEEFHTMCVLCHGAPGVERSEIGTGLYPLPPDLAKSADDLSKEEIFWVTKHGMKMTGMPAFGPTHGDRTIWAMVAVVEKLPEWSPEDYKAAITRAGLAPGGSIHEHVGGDVHEQESEKPEHHEHGDGHDEPGHPDH